jgi:two-component system chemotaxis response regulator CheY
MEVPVRVLIVDDSRSMRMILKKQLVEAGFEVTEAENGQEALDALRKQGAHFDFALFDWNMPVMSGIELLGHVRADPALCVLPVLMVTSETELDYVSRALEIGANEYLMKPFTPEALKEKLDMIVIAA